MDTTALLNKLIDGGNLTSTETHTFLHQVLSGELSPVQIGATLTALRIKGETPEEISGLIDAMRSHMLHVKNAEDAIDVCGTGGDQSGTFNISTATALVVAGAGVNVAKHGNRAASSSCGSADVLEALGVNISLSSEQAEHVINSVGIVFLYAPLFHPATKHVVAVRKELKTRTVFNFLGPFLNPAGVKRQVIGVPNKEIAEKLIQVGKKLSYDRLLIVTSEDGLDEVSTFSKTYAFELKKGKVRTFEIEPAEFGIKTPKKDDLNGGNAAENAQIIKDILDGKKGPKRDIVVINSACALYIAGVVKTIEEGMGHAADSIDSGAAHNALAKLITETQKYA